MEDNYNSKTIAIGDVVITIRRPVLSESEYKQKEKTVKTALEIFGKATNLRFVHE